MDGLHALSPVGIPVSAPGGIGSGSTAAPGPAVAVPADGFEPGAPPPAPVIPRAAGSGPASGSPSGAPGLRAIPDGDALLAIPAGEGGGTAIHKIPTAEHRNMAEMKGPGGESLRLAPFSDGTRWFVTCLDARGEVRWRHAMAAGEKAGPIVPDALHGRVLVKTGTALLSLDAATGDEKARREFPTLNYLRPVLPHSNGEILLVDEKRLHRLDAETLAELGARDLAMRPQTVSEMADGSVFFLADSCPTEAQVLGPSGETRFEVHNGALNSTVTDEAGTIWMVDDKDIMNVVHHKQRDILRYEPSTGAVSRFPSTNNARAVVPRKDGSCLVFDDEVSRPALVLYGPDGTRGTRFEFETEGHLRQFILSEDQQHAYAVISRYFSDNRPSERYLARFDLPAPGTRVASPLGRFNPFQPTEKARTLYQTRGSQENFAPVVLDDGRILAFRDGAVDILHATGAVQKTVTDEAELRQEIGDARIGARNVRLGSTQDPDLLPEIRRVLEEVAGATGPVAGAPTAGRLNPDDDCLDFPIPLDIRAWTSLPGLPQAQDLEGLLAGATTPNFALRDEVTLSYPGQAGEVRLRVDKATIRLPDGQGSTRECQFSLGSGTSFTCALPVRLGDRFCLATGASDGRLRWGEFDERGHGIPSQVFDVGAPIARIDLADGFVRALGTDGRVLLFRPALASEGLRAEAPPSPGPVDGEGPGTAGTVVVEETQVIIGGVAIRRNPG